jgi:triphosphatase
MPPAVLRFTIPAASHAALTAETTRASASLERRTLATAYLDTRDGRLARAGLVWRTRREGRRWIQTLEAAGPSPRERLVHETIRPSADPDAAAHAGLPAGERLATLIAKARDSGDPVGVRFETRLLRLTRRIRTRGAAVDVTVDTGRLLAAGSTRRIRDVSFEHVSGSLTAALELVERWRRRFGLILEPRSQAMRGEALAAGSRFPPPRRARRPDYPASAHARQACCAVVDECLGQILGNAIGLAEGDPALRVDHVHQLRVGIRRLRSALRTFDGWIAPPPADLVDEIRVLFGVLGQTRDSDVLDSGVALQLEQVGAPALRARSPAAGPDAQATVVSDRTQRMLLGWLGWRASLDETPTDPAPCGPSDAASASAGAGGPADAGGAAETGTAADAHAPADAGDDADAALEPGPADDASAFRQALARRLRRWHRRIAQQWQAFDALDEPALHALRKRIKRQRYAVEFFAPVLPRKSVARYLEPLAAVQERMGELNDLFVARSHYQALVASDPAAWFALGWLAARLAEVRAAARPELRRLSRAEPPAP